MDTYPPIFYMNDVSRCLVRLVHALNARHAEAHGDGAIRAAYTFDAGPNAVIFTRREHAAEELNLAEGLRFERRIFHSTFATADQKEGMAAFAEKRKPEFVDA